MQRAVLEDGIGKTDKKETGIHLGVKKARKRRRHSLSGVNRSKGDIRLRGSVVGKQPERQDAS